MLLTPAVTVAAVWLTNLLTQRRSDREKLWELRRQGYGVMLSELAAVQAICDSAQAYMDEDVHRYFAEPVSNLQAAKINERMATVRERFAADYLILSDAFIAMMEKFEEEQTSFENDLPPESLERFIRAVRTWRPQLLIQARKEMPLQRSWWRRVT